jgi:hypothetical protein
MTVDDWLAKLKAGYATNRSGDPYKSAAIRAYEYKLRQLVLPTLGHFRLGELTAQDGDSGIEVVANCRGVVAHAPMMSV